MDDYFPFALVLDGEGSTHRLAIGGRGALRPAGIRRTAPGTAATQTPVQYAVRVGLHVDDQGQTVADVELGDRQTIPQRGHRFFLISCGHAKQSSWAGHVPVHGRPQALSNPCGGFAIRLGSML